MSRTETASSSETTLVPPRSSATDPIPSSGPKAALPAVDDDAPEPAPAKADAGKEPAPAASTGPEADAANPAAAPAAVPQATIDMEQFNQILDLDGDDPDCEFSASMVGAYFGQAAHTFKEMDEALTAKDLGKLSELGHFLKGSSAQLGVSRVQASCEKIQHYGQLKDQEKNEDLTDVQALDMIGAIVGSVKLEYATAETWFKDYFKEKDVDVIVEEMD